MKPSQDKMVGRSKLIEFKLIIPITINNRNSHTKTANQWAIMSLICIDATTDANVFVSGGDGAS